MNEMNENKEISLPIFKYGMNHTKHFSRVSLTLLWFPRTIKCSINLKINAERHCRNVILGQGNLFVQLKTSKRSSN